jgi:hypothetical protein
MHLQFDGYPTSGTSKTMRYAKELIDFASSKHENGTFKLFYTSTGIVFCV